MRFDISFEFDTKEYPPTEVPAPSGLFENISLNFPCFGFYYRLIEPSRTDQEARLVTGNASEDLGDIIIALMEVKWRYENNGQNDACWYFELIFYSHLRQKIIDLLQFMKEQR